MNLCYINSRFSRTLLCCILPSEMCCCLYLITCAASSQLNLLFYTSAERIAKWTPMCLHYSLYYWRKDEQVFPRDIFHLRDSSKSFFSIHTILDNFVWYAVEWEPNKTSYNTKGELKARIAAFINLNKETAEKVCRRFQSHLEDVVEANGDFLDNFNL